ncbi:hypothetical protein L873DRAFT_1211694 [Choiromyces venosus 120613-1]|uniref:HECT-type E3 ubiquitin transferase n=1 Tax=Choiromyces venosus 120613-1 TaxID=1336337 RepID=A0A3N4JI86_9PEZI|nr:hypothetical protein L873DRAFT_1211694 [Choiromyces venosus 120613-1]
MPPRRVTRSSTRQLSDQAALLSSNSNSQTPVATSPTATTSTNTAVPSSSKPPRKRKNSATAAEASEPPTSQLRSRKRSKAASFSSPVSNQQPEIPAAPQSGRRKGKGKRAELDMKDQGPAGEPSNSATASDIAIPKRRGSRGKKSAGDNPATPSSTLSSSSRRAASKMNPELNDPDVPMSEPNEEDNFDEDHDEDMADQGAGDDDDQDREEDYEREDEDEDDVFDGSYLGGVGGSSGLSNTLRALSGMVSGISSRLRDNLANLRQKEDPSTQLIALQELAEILLVSTEDNLSGHFSPDQFVKELVSLMEDQGPFGENPEMMLLACRCIANLMEALPAATANVVYGGAVPVLCRKLMEIQYIDLAEQALSTLEKISVEYPTSIVREGGLTACLTYLDFFATNVQRTAVTTAANCCRNIPDDCFPTVRDVMPILLNVLGSSDQKVVEQACQCVARIVESFRHYPDKLEQLMSKEMMNAILQLLLPGTTNLVGPYIHTQFLRVLSIIAKASPRLSVDMFKMNIVDTLYQILTGVSPPVAHDGAAMKNDSVMTMQALIHRPREQVSETLNVICELLPGLPHDDVFGAAFDSQDSSGGTTKAPSDEGEDDDDDPDDKRRKMLEDCKGEMKRFATVLLPTLTDAYSSTVNLSVRQKVLNAQLKMISNLDADILNESLSCVQFASHLASILSQQDHPTLVMAALQAAELLLRRLPEIYQYHFYREGVISEISKLASKKDEQAALEKEAAERGDIDRESEDSRDSEDRMSSSPVSSRSSSSSRHVPASTSTGMADWITERAKRFMDGHDKDENAETRQKAVAIMEELKSLATGLKSKNNPEALFERLATYFDNNSLSSISSFELLNSHIVEALLAVLSNSSDPRSIDIRRAFLEVFMRSGLHPATSSEGDTPFSVLVHKLQDLLSRSEHFEVVTVHQNTFDGNRSSAASMLAKQLRLKLVADEDSEIPRPYRNIMVSIHAIATFKALDDYLRPRISLSERPRSGRRDPSGAGGGGLSNALAAFAAAAGLATPNARPGGPPGDAASSSTSAPPRPRQPRRQSRNKRSNPEGASASSSRAKVPGAERENQPTQPSGQEPLECMDERPIPEDDDMDEMDAVLEDLDRDLDEEPESEAGAVNLEVGTTGKVTARKDDGTRVATPSGALPATRNPGSSSQTPTPTNRGLPAGYPGTIPSSLDWHIEFSIGDHVISNDMTIYRAVQLGRNDTAEDQTFRNVWSAVHPIKFRRVTGPTPPEGSLSPAPDSSQTNTGFPASLDKNKVSSSILQLLSILHALNANLDDVFTGDKEAMKPMNPQPLSQFVNTKLTAKLNRQLEEPLIVASACLPSWSEDLARLYPFLFPFETRHLFLQSTSFGYSRSMTRWQNSQSTGDSRQDRHRDDNRPFLGRLQRQKVRISRLRILESAIKVMDLYGASPSVLEVEYFEEVGTGLGPTLEFYSSVSRAFARKKIKLWRENESSPESEFAFGQQGLFPAPMSDVMAESENGRKVLHLFTMLGKFVARSMLDSRIIDISFNPTFFRTGENVDEAVAPSLGAVKTVDKDLASSMKLLRKFALAKEEVDHNKALSPSGKAKRAAQIVFDGVHVEDLGLDLTLPGYPHIELIPGGGDVLVTIDNVKEYVDKVIDLTLGSGVRRQAEAFRSGFSQVFPYSALRAFTPDELVMLFGRNEEDWSLETLMDSIKADHGFNMDSKSVRNLLTAMSEFNAQERRDFLQFVTGSPKLPIGGFKSLTPLFTVVCKPSEPPYTSDDYLPSVMTCVNYLKLPDYSTFEILKKRLSVAIQEGQGAFHLS